MKLSIIGSGHVGLVTGACFAEHGHDVLCVDSDEEKVRGLRAGIMPFFEPELPELVVANTKAGRLRFSTSNAEAAMHGEAVFISVWTPPLPTGRADLSFVEKVSRDIAENLPKGEFRLIVEKSTVPVRTCERVIKTINRYARPGSDFEVASNPEFLREGTAIKDTLFPDRIVCGVSSDRAREMFDRVYEGFPGERVFCDVKSAELIKHASNSFLATKISFINSVGRVCDLSGADVDLVARGMGLDPRIAPQFLKAGVGYGGSCFPKDVSAFVDISRELGFEFKILEEVQRLNADMRGYFTDKVERELWNLGDKAIAVLGLAFKPDTDDMRSAPAVTIIEDLIRRGALVRTWDPVAIPVAKRAMKGLMDKLDSAGKRDRLVFSDSIEDACRGAEAVLVVTEWPQIRDADWKALRGIVSTALLFDGRNCIDPSAAKEAGWEYKGVGR